MIETGDTGVAPRVVPHAVIALGSENDYNEKQIRAVADELGLHASRVQSDAGGMIKVELRTSRLWVDAATSTVQALVPPEIGLAFVRRYGAGMVRIGYTYADSVVERHAPSYDWIPLLSAWSYDEPDTTLDCWWFARRRFPDACVARLSVPHRAASAATLDIDAARRCQDFRRVLWSKLDFCAVSLATVREDIAVGIAANLSGETETASVYISDAAPRRGMVVDALVALRATGLVPASVSGYQRVSRVRVGSQAGVLYRFECSADSRLGETLSKLAVEAGLQAGADQ